MEDHPRPHKLAPVLAPLINRPRLPGLRIEHAPRRALMTRLVRVILAQPFIAVRARPAPRMLWTPQCQPKQAYAFHDFAASKNPPACGSAQNLAAQLGIDGKKLSCCHGLNPHRTARSEPAQARHVRSRLRTSDINVVGSFTRATALSGSETEAILSAKGRSEPKQSFWPAIVRAHLMHLHSREVVLRSTVICVT